MQFIWVPTRFKIFLKRKLFPEGLGERTATFYKGVQYSLLAAVLTRFICGLTTMITARYIGPKEFGEANLSLAAVLWIQVPLFLGLPLAFVHFISKNPEEKNEWMAEGLGLLTVLMMVTLGAGFIFRSFWAQLLGISDFHFVLALFWCFCCWPFAVGRTVSNTTERFQARAYMELLYAILFPLIVYVTLKKGYNSGAYILGLSIPYLVVGVGGLFYLRPSLKGIFNFGSKSKKMFLYALIGSLGSFADALIDSPARLVINKVFNTADVGVMSAYQGGSTQMAVFFLTAAAQVFFPIASRTPDKIVLFKKLNRIIWQLFPVAAMVFLAGLFLYLKILGRNYPIQLISCLIFSIAAALSLITGIFRWFIVSFGWRGICFNAVLGVGIGLINLGGCQWLVSRFHIPGAGLAYLIANVVGISLMYIPGLLNWLNQGGRESGIKI
jgi:O-antigen/teichoic acid export membrane protein